MGEGTWSPAAEGGGNLLQRAMMTSSQCRSWQKVPDFVLLENLRGGHVGHVGQGGHMIFLAASGHNVIKLPTGARRF